MKRALGVKKWLHHLLLSLAQWTALPVIPLMMYEIYTSVHSGILFPVAPFAALMTLLAVSLLASAILVGIHVSTYLKKRRFNQAFPTLPNHASKIKKAQILSGGGEPIPGKIHFIWLGGVLPEKYLVDIIKLGEVAKRSGFELNVWVDHKSNLDEALLLNRVPDYHKRTEYLDLAMSNASIAKRLADCAGIRMRNIEELSSKITTDDFYKSDHRRRDFIYSVQRELIGFKNLAAASDWLRYEILRQEGGYYFDTDTHYWFDKNNDFLKRESPLYGIKSYFYCSEGELELELEGKNSLIAVLKNHPALEFAIMHAIDYYKKLDNKKLESEPIQDGTFENIGLTLDADQKKIINNLAYEIRILSLVKPKRKIIDETGKDIRIDVETPDEANERDNKKVIAEKTEQAVATIEKMIVPMLPRVSQHEINEPDRAKKIAQDILTHVQKAMQEQRLKLLYGDEQTSRMDGKRFPYGLPKNRLLNIKFFETIKSAGPAALSAGIKNFLTSKEKFNKNAISAEIYESSSYANIMISDSSDQTWVTDTTQRPKSIWGHSFDESALPKNAFFYAPKAVKSAHMGFSAAKIA